MDSGFYFLLGWGVILYRIIILLIAIKQDTYKFNKLDYSIGLFIVKIALPSFRQIKGEIKINDS